MTLYSTLGVQHDASPTEIKAAYRRLAQTYHPDRPTGDKEAFQRIQQAHDVLMDPERRAQYDRTGTTTQNNLRHDMLAELAKMIVAAVAHCASPDTTDLIDFVRNQILQVQSQLVGQRGGIERAIVRLNKALQRLQLKGQGEDLVAAMLRSTAMSHEAQLAGIDAGARRIEAMLEMLAEYEYTVDQRPEEQFFQFTRAYAG